MSNLLSKRLQSAGYTVSPNAKGRYIQGLIRLMGDLPAMDFLRDEYMVRLLSNAQLRKEKSFTYKQLHQIAQPETHTDRFYNQMQTLTAKGMFLRGYSLQCPVCDLDTWYSMSDISEQVTCQGCRFAFQLPLTLPFSYRPNRLLAEALKSGAMTILLTALWLYEQDKSMQWQTESVVHQANLTTDIDIVAQIGDEIWLIECKDNFKTTDSALDTLIEQLRIGYKVAQDIGASRFLLATLYPKAIPDDLANFLVDHQIDTLTRTDLLRVG
jgi:hypothetical protein